MSKDESNPGEAVNGEAQTALSQFKSAEPCSSCGYPSTAEAGYCHPSELTSYERQLETSRLLFQQHRGYLDKPRRWSVCGPDLVEFPELYYAISGLLPAEKEFLHSYVNAAPVAVDRKPWLEEIYEQHHTRTDELVLGLRAARIGCEQHVEDVLGGVDPVRVFEHLVFVSQYGLIPGFNRLGGGKRLRDLCADYYGVEIRLTDNSNLVERRVDRTKVYSTTPQWREDWDADIVELAETSQLPVDLSQFTGISIYDEHRDHNLVARFVKSELARRPHVDWVTAPHLRYIPVDTPEFAENADIPEKGRLGFDFAGFEETESTNSSIRYLGIVQDWDDTHAETFQKLLQITQTDAIAIAVMCNRDTMHEFLHFLKANELVTESTALPETLEDYEKIPNTPHLHAQLLADIPLFDNVVLIPRRKLLDEGLVCIDSLLGREPQYPSNSLYHPESPIDYEPRA